MSPSRPKRSLRAAAESSLHVSTPAEKQTLEKTEKSGYLLDGNCITN